MHGSVTDLGADWHEKEDKCYSRIIEISMCTSLLEENFDIESLLDGVFLVPEVIIF